MMAADHTRIGLAGINERARRLLIPGLVGAPRAHLAAVCSRDERKARAVAASLGPDVQAFSGVAAMAGSGAVDAVLLNTPVETHLELCLAALREGCAVICEKPLAAATDQAITLQEAAQAAGRRTAVNFTYRSVAGFRMTERLLAVPGIGRPMHAEFSLLQGHNFLPGYPRRSALLDSGVHLLDTVSGLCERAGMGHLAALSAAPMLDRSAQGQRVDFGWAFTARTSGDVVVSGTLSRGALGWRNGLRWSLYGEEGAIMVELDAERTEVRLARRDEGRPQGQWRPVPLTADIQDDEARFPVFHLDRLVGAIRGEESFPGFAEAVTTHHLADALAASAAGGRWVTVRR
ncbi:MAG TPA: Gfo/Idh/MocA family oxidoreductase [Chloroflexota bacterium]|nr:Gfo/Idh/MocA family oxidoreductase [Chloroflexota bacterium]